jgi:UDP:flavonoid glycosyltransferase YjiC (YdhE family)
MEFVLMVYGHATRDMPIIDYLIKNGHKVYIVTGKDTKDFLLKKNTKI